jgi:putative endonuclease
LKKSKDLAKVLSKGGSFIRVKPMSAWFYMLRLKSGALYIGATTDMDQRYKDHCSGKACGTTKLDPPVALVLSEEFETNLEARRRESQVKRWSRAKKEALVAGDRTKLRKLSKPKKRR